MAETRAPTRVLPIASGVPPAIAGGGSAGPRATDAAASPSGGPSLGATLVPIVGLALLAVVPFVAGEYLQDLVVKIVILAIFALSLELLAGTDALRVVDLGTGSGAIALAVKHGCRDASVLATDASPAALEVARGNARRVGLEVGFAEG